MEVLARNIKQLGANIRRARRMRGLTQAELGARINRRQATLSNLEAAEEGATLDTLFAVLAALDLELVIRDRTKGETDLFDDLF